MATIDQVLEADLHDQQIARTILSQIDKWTLMGNGFTKYYAIKSGAQLDFQLARPYGHRTIEIVLNVWDYYDVKVYRFGKQFKKHLVTEVSNVDFTQLDSVIHNGIVESCQ